MTFDIKAVLVRRILVCLDEARTKEELLARYSQLYPPTRLERIFSAKRDDEIEYEISKNITRLIQLGYIKVEVISFTNRALRIPLVKYSITHKGMQEFYAIKKK